MMTKLWNFSAKLLRPVSKLYGLTSVFRHTPPGGIILWTLGPMLGILTIFITEFTMETSSATELYCDVYANKLGDLYLLVVVMTASIMVDMFELAWTTRAGHFSLWSVVYIYLIVVLVISTAVSVEVSSAEPDEIANNFLASKGVVVWFLLMFLVLIGIIARVSLEKRNNN